MFLYPGGLRVNAPSRASSNGRTSYPIDLGAELTPAVRYAHDSRRDLGFELGLAHIPVGDGSPLTASGGPRL